MAHNLPGAGRGRASLWNQTGVPSRSKTYNAYVKLGFTDEPKLYLGVNYDFTVINNGQFDPSSSRLVTKDFCLNDVCKLKSEEPITYFDIYRFFEKRRKNRKKKGRFPLENWTVLKETRQNGTTDYRTEAYHQLAQEHNRKFSSWCGDPDDFVVAFGTKSHSSGTNISPINIGNTENTFCNLELRFGNNWQQRGNGRFCEDMKRLDMHVYVKVDKRNGVSKKLALKMLEDALKNSISTLSNCYQSKVQGKTFKEIVQDGQTNIMGIKPRNNDIQYRNRRDRIIMADYKSEVEAVIGQMPVPQPQQLIAPT